MVARKEANFSIDSLTFNCKFSWIIHFIYAIFITDIRSTVVDFTVPYYYDRLSIVSQAPRTLSTAFALFSTFPFTVTYEFFISVHIFEFHDFLQDLACLLQYFDTFWNFVLGD